MYLLTFRRCFCLGKNLYSGGLLLKRNCREEGSNGCETGGRIPIMIESSFGSNFDMLGTIQFNYI